MLTLFRATAVTFMMVMSALERQHPGFVLAFAFGRGLSSAYGFLAGTWPLGVLEAIWRRWPCTVTASSAGAPSDRT